ncbi:serine/threonine-protein kinase GCN2 [Populus alba x Populus x berolinensis]|nr:serine/threonine-protein kinase GCN2 [Populus alba x Populus x berolinensis]
MTTSFSMGISYLLHSHFPSSTSSSSSQPLSLHVKKNSNNNEMTGRRRVVSACMGQEDPKDIVFSKKRAVLFLGISVLPFLQLRARALEGLVTSGSSLGKGDHCTLAHSSKFFGGSSDSSSDSESPQQKISDHRYKEDFEEIQCLGNGSYGKVTRCKHKLDLMEYAVKKIKIGYHDRDVILREASTHAKMHHKHIVRYHQAWIENLQPKNDDMRGSSSAGEDTAALFIQMECCPMTLHDLLSKETGLKGRFMMAKQIVEGVCFIHANEFVHRDLGTKNIFVGASQAQDEKEIKIGDFGIAVFCKKGEKVQVDAEGNKTYRAPEAETGPIDAKADVYSLGIILFMLLHPTTSGTERKNSLDKLKRKEFPDAWKNESYRPLKSLLSDMLAENPDDRPSAEEVLPRVQDLSPLFEHNEAVQGKEERMDGKVDKELETGEKVDKEERTEAVGEDGAEEEEEA